MAVAADAAAGSLSGGGHYGNSPTDRALPNRARCFRAWFSPLHAPPVAAAAELFRAIGVQGISRRHDFRPQLARRVRACSRPCQKPATTLQRTKTLRFRSKAPAKIGDRLVSRLVHGRNEGRTKNLAIFENGFRRRHDARQRRVMFRAGPQARRQRLHWRRPLTLPDGWDAQTALKGRRRRDLSFISGVLEEVDLADHRGVMAAHEQQRLFRVRAAAALPPSSAAPIPNAPASTDWRAASRR